MRVLTQKFADDRESAQGFGPVLGRDAETELVGFGSIRSSPVGKTSISPANFEAMTVRSE